MNNKRSWYQLIRLFIFLFNYNVNGASAVSNNIAETRKRYRIGRIVPRKRYRIGHIKQRRLEF
jgi:hypothetical protein